MISRETHGLTFILDRLGDDSDENTVSDMWEIPRVSKVTERDAWRTPEGSAFSETFRPHEMDQSVRALAASVNKASN